jgi:hypothetical protein
VVRRAPEHLDAVRRRRDVLRRGRHRALRLARLRRRRRPGDAQPDRRRRGRLARRDGRAAGRHRSRHVGQLAIGRHLDVARRRLDPGRAVPCAGASLGPRSRALLPLHDAGRRDRMVEGHADDAGLELRRDLARRDGPRAAAAAAAAVLSGGTDGAAIADSDFQGALDRIPKDLGPGQVAAPGRRPRRSLQLLDHAQQRNRFALLDLADTASDTTLVDRGAGRSTPRRTTAGATGSARPVGRDPGPDGDDHAHGAPERREPRRSTRAPTRSATRIRRPPGRNGTARFALDLSQPRGPTRSGNAQRSGRDRVAPALRERDRHLRHADARRSGARRAVVDGPERALRHGLRRASARGRRRARVRSGRRLRADARRVPRRAHRGGERALPRRGALRRDPAEAFYVDTGPAINPPARLAARHHATRRRRYERRRAPSGRSSTSSRPRSRSRSRR